MAGGCTSWEDFVTLHEPQLISIGLPKSLWKELYHKLSPKEIHDAGSVFELRQGERESGGWSLHTKRTMQKESGVFLIDHAWTSDGGLKAREKLQKSPELLVKMREIMCLDKEDEDKVDYLDQEEVLARVGGVDKERARKALEETKNDLLEALCCISYEDYDRTRSSKADGEPEQPLTYEEFRSGFLQAVGPERQGYLSEEYIRKMYERYVRDKLENPESTGLGIGQTAHYRWSEEEDVSITVYISIPANAKKRDIVNHLTPKKWTFGIKGKEAIIDGYFHDTVSSSESFWTIDSPGVVQMTLQKPEHEDTVMWPVLIKGEKQLTEKEIVQQAREQDQEMTSKVNQVLEHMWYYNQTYRAVMSAGGPQESVWYIMSHMGSAITHSSQPNLKCAPFVYSATGIASSLIWPLRELKEGEMCSRDFCPRLTASETPVQLEARMMAFKYDIPEDIPAAFIKQLAEGSVLPKADNVAIKVNPLYDGNSNTDKYPKLVLDLKVYLDKPDDKVQSALKHLGCKLVESPKEADTQWISGRFVAESITANQRVNRLEGEAIFLEQHLLSRLVQESFGEVPWFPNVYDLSSQLAAVYADHHLGGIPSYWIVKSANPSRFAFKPVVTSDVQRITRLVETGSTVASKFCLLTAISHKRNFCLQYTVMVQSFAPLVLHVHQTPSVRLAAKEYNPLKEVDEYDSSAVLTTATKNTQAGTGRNALPNHKVSFQEFLEDFTKNYLEKKMLAWEEVQNKIYKCITKLFVAVSSVLLHSGGDPHAVYGVDVLLKESLEPLLIGIDQVPTFPDERSAQEVLYLMFSKQGQDCGIAASRHMVRLSIDSEY